MIKLWRPAETDWGNRWPAEEALNRLTAEGWTLRAVLPPCDYSQHPTFILENAVRWRDPHKAYGWRRVKAELWWWRYVIKRWWGALGEGRPE